MKLQLRPKECFYKNFPEFKNKEIIFLGLRRMKSCDGGFMLNLMIGDVVDDLAIGYFKLKIN